MKVNADVLAHAQLIADHPCGTPAGTARFTQEQLATMRDVQAPYECPVVIVRVLTSQTLQAIKGRPGWVEQEIAAGRYRDMPCPVLACCCDNCANSVFIDPRGGVMDLMDEDIANPRALWQ